MGCSNLCSVKPSAVAGYPLYGINHPGCPMGRPGEQGTEACPAACTPPTQADQGVPAVFLDGGPFIPGPAIAKRLVTPVAGGENRLFVGINAADAQAVCIGFPELGFQLFGPRDGGGHAPGTYAIVGSGTEMTAAATRGLVATALGGQVTLTGLDPVEGTFSITGFSADAGAGFQGSFRAFACD